MENYWNKHGLLNAWKNEDFAENSPLFTYEYILIRELKGESTKPEKEALRAFIEKCKVSKGLYNQKPEMFGNDEDYMSHDQLTTFVSFSKKYGYDWHFDIWEELKHQWFRYNNVNRPETFWKKLTNKRFLHPRDIIYIGYLADNFICKLLSPLLIFFMWMSCKKTWKVRPTLETRIIYVIKKFKFFPKESIRRMRHTDGKLLTFIRTVPFLDKWALKKSYEVGTKAITKNKVFNNWNETYGIYFKDRPDHPINIALSNFRL